MFNNSLAITLSTQESIACEQLLNPERKIPKDTKFFPDLDLGQGTSMMLIGLAIILVICLLAGAFGMFKSLQNESVGNFIFNAVFSSLSALGIFATYRKSIGAKLRVKAFQKGKFRTGIFITNELVLRSFAEYSMVWPRAAIETVSFQLESTQDNISAKPELVITYRIDGGEKRNYIDDVFGTDASIAINIAMEFGDDNETD